VEEEETCQGKGVCRVGVALFEAGEFERRLDRGVNGEAGGAGEDMFVW